MRARAASPPPPLPLWKHRKEMSLIVFPGMVYGYSSSPSPSPLLSNDGEGLFVGIATFCSVLG